jgi:DnaJ-class molecular chaperone
MGGFMDVKYRIKIEEPCKECDGQGEILSVLTQKIYTCSDCDGSGYQEESISLGMLKELLEDA